MCLNLRERPPECPFVLQQLIVVTEVVVIPPLVCLGLLARLLNMIISVSVDYIAG
jgi:hypothetical protein